MKPLSKSRATPKPVKTPPNAADWSSTKTNWKAVYPGGKSKPGTCPTLERPPAKAVKKNSGKMIDGSRNDGLVTKLWIVRQATASVTSRKRLTSAPAASAARGRRR